MTIERTGRFSWKVTGPLAARWALPLMLAFLGMTILSFATVYFTVNGVALLSGVPFLVALVAWAILCGSVTLNGRRIALTPPLVSGTLNLIAMTAAVYHYGMRQEWPALLIGAFGLFALVSWAKQLQRRFVVARG